MSWSWPATPLRRPCCPPSDRAGPTSPSSAPCRPSSLPQPPRAADVFPSWRRPARWPATNARPREELRGRLRGRPRRRAAPGCPGRERLARRGRGRRRRPDEIAPAFVDRDGRRTDTIVLACTHYPLLVSTFDRIAPWPVAYLDPAPAIARRVDAVLTERGFPAGRSDGGRDNSACVFTSGRGPGPALARVLRERGLDLETRPRSDPLRERNDRPSPSFSDPLAVRSSLSWEAEWWRGLRGGDADRDPADVSMRQGGKARRHQRCDHDGAPAGHETDLEKEEAVSDIVEGVTARPDHEVHGLWFRQRQDLVPGTVDLGAGPRSMERYAARARRPRTEASRIASKCDMTKGDGLSAVRNV